jgi:hypothetical protein
MGAVAIGVGVVTITIGVAVIVGVAVTIYVAVGVTVGVGVGVPACFPTHPDNKIASPMTVMKIIDLNCTITNLNSFNNLLEDKGIDFIPG